MGNAWYASFHYSLRSRACILKWIVMTLPRAMLHDPEIYPEPEKFRPERFITPEGTLSDDDIISVFGFGRR